MPKRAEAPWWMEAGTEVCSSCGQRFAYGIERRCEDCDTPMCPVCCEAACGEPVACCDCKPKENHR